MTARIVLWLAVMLAATAAAAGCSSGNPGQALPATSTDATSSTVPRSSGSPTTAPKVLVPLDATKFLTNPCSALTAADIAGLKITNAVSKAASSAVGPVCSWTGDSTGSVSIGWSTATPDGLSDLYAKASTIAYWRPITIDGYPGAFGDTISDGRPQGDCSVNVAVSDHLFFGSEFVDPVNTSASCDLARQAAQDVLRNLKGAGGS